MIKENGLPELETEQPRSESGLANAELPTEPFACPACGQMLAPSCRVCVACNQPIDLTRLRKPRSLVAPFDFRRNVPATTPVRFSWGIFLLVLGFWCIAAIAAQRLLGPIRGRWVMGGTVILSSVWVFYDAQQQGVARPLRWGLGSLLLWIIFFPLYLARRRTPEAPCPFVEGNSRRFTLVLLLIFIISVLVSAVFFVLNGPPR